MTTNTQQIASKNLRALAIAVILGVSSGAHALCLNPDGSLDDSSMNTASIDRGLLPACEVPQPTATQVMQPKNVKPQESVAKPAAESVKPLKNARRPDQSARIQGDCRTANGESREGTLGAVDMLRACGG